MFAYHEHYTVQDYQQWEGDWELINGMPYAMSPAPTLSHQIVAGNILTELTNKIRQTSENCSDCYALMEVDWEVSHDTVVRPDVMIFCGKAKEKIISTPLAIFEVSFPSTAKRDEQLKFEIYEKEGVLFYIQVYPLTNLAKVFQWVNGAYQKRGDYTSEEVVFEIKQCQLLLDFSKIWRDKAA